MAELEVAVENIGEYGLVVLTFFMFLATLWYSAVTHQRAKIMKRELELRSRARLGLKIATIDGNEWKHVTIYQEVVNIGAAFATVTSAVLCWHSRLGGETPRRVVSSPPCPVYLAPSQTFRFCFEIEEADLHQLPKGSFPTALALITGHTEYEYVGLDEVAQKVESNLPSGV